MLVLGVFVKTEEKELVWHVMTLVKMYQYLPVKYKTGNIKRAVNEATQFIEKMWDTHGSYAESQTYYKENLNGK